MQLNLPSKSIDVFLEKIIQNYEHYSALALVGKAPISYRQIGDLVHQLQQELISLNVRQGQNIILLGENSPNWCIAYLAITGIGAVVVPILSEFPESDISHIINHSEAAGIFIDEKISKTLDIPAIEQMTFIINLNDFKIKKRNTTKKLPPRFEPVKIDEDDLAEILYTSGTTGHSKGVMLTHNNILSNALSGPEALGGIQEGSVVLNLLPLAHAYGSTTSMLGAFSCGATLYLIDRKPSPKILMEALETTRPMLVTGVPLIFEKIFHKRVVPELTRHKAIHLLSKIRLTRNLIYRMIGERILKSFGGRLQSFVIGGASLNQEVETFLREGRIPYAIGYGLSECSPLVSGNHYSMLKFGSVGKAVKDISIKIDQADPQTGIGEICVKGPAVMQGYYKNEEETKKILLEDGWLRTGDLGYIDQDGYLFIKGRIKNVYVGPSGENIYPEIIEDKLKESIFVEEALAYHENGKIIARVYLDYEYIQTILNAQKHTIRPEEIAEILEDVRKDTNKKLPDYSKINKLIEQPEPFVKTPTNKIKRMLYVPDY
jgi:long-chain acyl-CoA synthetase